MPITRKRINRRALILTGRMPTRRGVRVGGGGAGKRKMMGKTTEMIVPTFLHMLNTVKLYHWKTTSFSTHKATDELYGSLNEKIDHFVEVMLGKKEMGGRSKLLNVPMLKLSVYSNNDAFTKQIEMYKAFLMDLSEFDPVMNADLLAIRDEILADFNKFLYLLSLN